MAHETPLLASTLSSSGARPTAGGSGLVPYRLTVRQFEKMIDAGIFRDDDHVELLGGLLVDKMVKKDPHNFSVGEVAELSRALLPRDWVVREEKSVVLGLFWRPEPDVAIARGPRERYRAKGPRRADLGMLIEVADSSYAKDRGPKWRKYAASGVSVYWIVNLPLRQIEVYADPFGRGKSAGYREMKTYGVDDEVSLILEGHEFGRIKVSEIIA
jgi:Uma2 family endonuclease